MIVECDLKITEHYGGRRALLILLIVSFAETAVISNSRKLIEETHCSNNSGSIRDTLKLSLSTVLEQCVASLAVSPPVHLRGLCTASVLVYSNSVETKNQPECTLLLHKGDRRGGRRGEQSWQIAGDRIFYLSIVLSPML